MSTRQYIFGPLTEVPSDHLEKNQDATLDQRADGAGNLLAAGLDSANAAHRAILLVASLDPAAVPGPVALDGRMDYRDRVLVVDYQADPLKDIRPGEAKDNASAMFRGSRVIYTRLGNAYHHFARGLFSLFVDPATGALQYGKDAGYVVVTLRAGCQLKERS